MRGGTHPIARVAAVFALLVLFASAATTSLVRDSVTYDETNHVGAGFTHLDRGDFRLSPMVPPLAKMWAALPLWIGRMVEPDYGSIQWKGPRALPDGGRTGADRSSFGFEFLNGPLADRDRRDPMRLLVPARMMIVAAGLALGLVVLSWAGSLGGWRAGLVALFLYAISPTMLAHTRLVTTDLAAAFGFAATLWSFRRFCRRPGLPRAAVTGLALGAALLSKLSGLLLIPILFLLGALWAVFESGDGIARSGRRLLTAWGGVLAATLVAWVCLWGGYGFHFRAAAEDEYRLDWDSVQGRGGAAGRILDVVRDGKLAPEAYAFGLKSFVFGGGMETPAFLNGRISKRGWWYWFPATFLMKTPPGLLVLLGWVAVAGALRTRGRSFDAWFLALPAMIYAVVSMISPLNIGHRHLLPLEPIILVAAGTGIAALSRSRAGAIASSVLLAGCVVSFAAATPRYLSYVNVFGGGSRNGWRHLVDSNVDWGQDLIRLKRWMDRNQVPEIDLAYFGTGDPAAYGIACRKVMMVRDFRPEEAGVVPGKGDLFAASVTLLQGIGYDRDRVFYEGANRRDLLDEPEALRWMAARDEAERRGAGYPRLADWAVRQGLMSEEQRRDLESHLIYTWLDRLRDTQEPIGRAGDSILIYRVP